MASAASLKVLALVDEEDWSALQKQLSDYDQQRETLIKTCRDAQKLAKQAIYALHRGGPADFAKAAEQLQQVEEIARQLQPIVTAHPSLRFGSYAAVMEEYAEAKAFQVYLLEGRLIKTSEMPLVDVEEYLGGVLDFTGELNRYSIQRATVRDVAAVQKMTQLADTIMGMFLQFDLRNGNLRKKYDVLKYTVRKMENTLYELSLARPQADGGVRQLEADDPMGTAQDAAGNSDPR